MLHFWKKIKPACAVLLAGNFLMVMSGSAASGRSAGEISLRQSLGIPAEAQEVIVFAQSSHVDPDWLMTADQYQRLLTDRTFDKALKQLEKDPRYVYSVECTFFFKRYFDSHPDKREALRKFVNDGRIKFTGTGITSPDSLIPEGENLVRDYVAGYYWLKSQGMTAEPRLAYYADSFGESPSVPTILNALGYKYTAFTRIAGEYFIETDRRSKKAFPFPGSAAELLQKKLKTLDFVWQGPDNSEVIAHWNAFTYFMGDMIDTAGVVKTYGLTAGVPARFPAATNAKIDSYIKQLRPLSPTGYMFCPIGGDFTPPVPGLPKIMADYNKSRYPKTGVYAVFAGLEDYMTLVEFQKDKLPKLKLDPNPLFMGFYASRPELKQRARKLSKGLLLAETLGVMAQDRGLAKYPELAPAWELALFADHHDFITGTAPDRVYLGEQLPTLNKAQEMVDQALASLGSVLTAPSNPAPKPIRYEQSGPVITVENDFYKIELDADKGGCITNWFDKGLGREILSGPSNDLIFYHDSGGLWRMGQELNHGKFQPLLNASDSQAALSAKTENGVLRVEAVSELDGREFTRTLYFRADQPGVRMKIRGAAGKRQTITVSFRTKVKAESLTMEIPYGVVERPAHRDFTPTFWAAKNWADLVDGSSKFGVSLALAAPAAVHSGEQGELELIALRYGGQERIFGLPLFAFPATGKDTAIHETEYAFWPHGPGDWRERKVFAQAEAVLSDSWIDPARPDLTQLAASVVNTGRDDVIATVVKKAESGEGVVVRLFSYADGPVSVRLSYSGKSVKKAMLANALEQELEELPVREGKVELKMPYSLATVLLMF